MKTYNKSKLITLLCCASVVFTWQSCSKNGSESVEGRVLEYGSNKPIANATVYLMEVKGTFLGPSGSSKIDSTTSDQNGRYKFTYMDNPYVSEIRGKANLYYDNHAYIMGTGRKLKTDLILDPHAWLRIHVKNVNPVDENDGISFETFSCNETGYVGTDIDEKLICQFRGNKSHKLYCNTFKIGTGIKESHLNLH